MHLTGQSTSSEIVDHFRDGQTFTSYALNEVFGHLADPAQFKIDRPLMTSVHGISIPAEAYTPIYRADLTGIVHERNYGHLDIRRIGPASNRIYGIRLAIEGDTKFLRHDVLLSLNESQVLPLPDPDGDYPMITRADVNGPLDTHLRRS